MARSLLCKCAWDMPRGDAAALERVESAASNRERLIKGVEAMTGSQLCETAKGMTVVNAITKYNQAKEGRMSDISVLRGEYREGKGSYHRDVC